MIYFLNVQATFVVSGNFHCIKYLIKSSPSLPWGTAKNNILQLVQISTNWGT